MNVFESINNTADRASDIGEEYVDKTYQYYKLKIFQQIAYIISMFGKVLMIGAVLFIGSIFLAIAAAIALGELVNSIPLGYLIVALLFMLSAFVIYKTRYLIDGKIIKKIHDKFYTD